MIDLLEYIGLALIIFGGCIYFLAVYMIAKYEKKLTENRLHKSFIKQKQKERL